MATLVAIMPPARRYAILALSISMASTLQLRENSSGWYLNTANLIAASEGSRREVRVRPRRLK
jgi:hypothetical protein